MYIYSKIVLFTVFLVLLVFSILQQNWLYIEKANHYVGVRYVERHVEKQINLNAE